MKIVDTKGMTCPKPLIQTKKALGEITKDESLRIIIDNDESKTNVMRFLKDNGIDAELKEKNGIYEIIANKLQDDVELSEVDEYCEVPEVKKANDYVFVFSKDYIGEGPEELGKKLMGGFLEALLYQEERPKKILFFNTGVKLVLNDSPHLETFKGLEEMGVEMLVCGVCLKYFDAVDKLGIGKVSNAFDILTSIREADKSINL